ncbi:MAG: hypothetical protein HY814_07770 [Candidatus Riflebacteria bacterium]|nr:hypothetical protein [Candidatus Riflebacteria bacterium]
MTMDLYDELWKLIDALNEAGASYAVCGGVALAIHGCTRATTDIDFLIPEAEVERVRDLLRPLGYNVPALPMTFNRGTSAERRVHRVSRIVGEETLTVDLLVVGTKLDEAWESRQFLDVGRRRVTCVSRDGLIHMKRQAGRLKDLADLEAMNSEDIP